MGTVVIDHVSIRVSDLEASRRLYEAALAPLGFVILEVEETDGRGYGFGRDERDDFAIHEPIDDPGRDRVTTGAHIAFAARSRDEVDAFHAAAIANGASDIGAPGVRDQYSDGYYGGFVLDLDGNNVEAVWHRPAT
ncbi:MAG: Glyoxalase/bleomycin resistance protein/dioxygenase [Thermoleophilia bacterium]|nr:Glyoxalase/bleomycin resistance protein/dioxygenase [Thermoleophilia bacterium]